jgi:hypothetical protein
MDSDDGVPESSKADPQRDDLIDDDADAADAAWVRQATGGISGMKTDAILSCPFCFTILSYLCQQ